MYEGEHYLISIDLDVDVSMTLPDWSKGLYIFILIYYAFKN